MKRKWSKRKPSSRTKAKKKAWDQFSKYIRLRDALKTTGTPFEAECVTCRNTYPIKKMHAGHFIPGRGNAVLFDEYGVFAQCVSCNLYKHGDPLRYRRRMVETYGETGVKEMEIMARVPRTIHITEFAMIQAFYLEAYKELGGK